jgi:hypothetical protein
LWLPWALAIVFALIALAGWLRSPDVGGGAQRVRIDRQTVRAPDAGSSGLDAGSGPAFVALSECLARLERARGAERSWQASPFIPTADAGLSSEARACLGRPDVVQLAEQMARERAASRRERARNERRASVRSALADSLGVTEADVDWLGEYACAVRSLREDTLADLEEGRAPSRQAMLTLRREREGALADVEARLGPERYAQFRAVGGVGILDDVVECEDDD